LSEIGATGRFIPMDVTKPADLANLHQTVLRDYGRLDVGFNNAGYQQPRVPLAEQDSALHDRVFDTNVRSAYLSLQHQIRIDGVSRSEMTPEDASLGAPSAGVDENVDQIPCSRGRCGNSFPDSAI
jgi:NAD(P)-dependent dehydrogenase (short-subunit alcohol dehydrogenase family)